MDSPIDGVFTSFSSVVAAAAKVLLVLLATIDLKVDENTLGLFPTTARNILFCELYNSLESAKNASTRKSPKIINKRLVHDQLEPKESRSGSGTGITQTEPSADPDNTIVASALISMAVTGKECAF